MESEQQIRVLVADDHDFVRKALVNALRLCKGLEVVADVSNGWEVSDACEKYQPEVMLMDLWMPEMNGFEAATILRHRFPNIKVIILSANDDAENIQKAMQLGIKRYLHKSISAEVLCETIYAVMKDNIIYNGGGVIS